MSLRVDIRKKFPGFTLEVAFEMERERLALLGESGCGKSMTLKCIAGIETPDSGIIEIDGKTVFNSEKKINLCPQERGTGFLFQHYGLFPTMTVERNIEIVLSGLQKKGKKERIGKLLEKMHLEELGGRYPAQLSGGQRQRAALARMLASDPRIIMLDEPFSALDSFLRSRMENELLETLAEFEGSVLYVSHDMDEAYRFCDGIVILENGRIEGKGTKEEIFGSPKTVASARLTGCRNIAEAVRFGENSVHIPSWGLTLQTEGPIPPDMSHAAIRAHQVRIPRENESINCFAFKIESIQESPFMVTKFLTTSEGTEKLLWETSIEGRRTMVSEGKQNVQVCIPAEHILLLS